MRRTGALLLVAGAVALSSAPRDARAVDLPKVKGTPVKLDVTETTIVAQRFEAREGEKPEDQGYFTWLNRLNLVFGWRKLTLGMRLDSSLYALRPEDRSFANTAPVSAYGEVRSTSSSVSLQRASG